MRPDELRSYPILNKDPQAVATNRDLQYIVYDLINLLTQLGMSLPIWKKPGNTQVGVAEEGDWRYAVDASGVFETQVYENGAWVAKVETPPY